MKELDVEAILDNLDIVTDFVNEQLAVTGCSAKILMQVDLAVEEIFVNIANYAYSPATGPATVRVEVRPDFSAVCITFIDHGIPYDPLAKADPDLSLSTEERAVGGLGIFLVKKNMDDISYEYVNGCNILRLKKNM